MLNAAGVIISQRVFTMCEKLGQFSECPFFKMAVFLTLTENGAGTKFELLQGMYYFSTVIKIRNGISNKNIKLALGTA